MTRSELINELNDINSMCRALILDRQQAPEQAQTDINNELTRLYNIKYILLADLVKIN